jgi:hypothetical protein
LSGKIYSSRRSQQEFKGNFKMKIFFSDNRIMYSGHLLHIQNMQF